jgi:hypothetical protein
MNIGVFFGSDVHLSIAQSAGDATPGDHLRAPRASA